MFSMGKLLAVWISSHELLSLLLLLPYYFPRRLLLAPSLCPPILHNLSDDEEILMPEAPFEILAALSN